MIGGDGMSSPTITSPAMTQLGMILGTAAYMSPEQAKGRQADKRSDVWAFGAVLYEMLSGQRAFKGDDVSDTLAAILRQDIDWNALPASTPASVRRLMARCRDRDVRRRLRDIGEARIVMDDPALSGASGMKRLTFGGKNRYPIWISNDRIAFQSDREGDLAIFWQSIDGGPAERLTKPEPGTSHVPDSWSAKVDSFLFDVIKGSDVSLWTYSMRDRKTTPFGDVHSPNPTNAVFSPHGGWVAYTKTEQNRARNYVQPFPPSGVQHQLPVGPGGIALQPLWSPDEKELFYNPAPGQFAWASVTTQPTFTLGNPEMVLRPFQTGPPTARRPYDITPDGRFIGLIEAGQPVAAKPLAPQVQVILNWFEELRARVPPTK
jgi:serine/threonine protein kinase